MYKSFPYCEYESKTRFCLSDNVQYVNLSQIMMDITDGVCFESRLTGKEYLPLSQNNFQKTRGLNER